MTAATTNTYGVSFGEIGLESVIDVQIRSTAESENIQTNAHRLSVLGYVRNKNFQVFVVIADDLENSLDALSIGKTGELTIQTYQKDPGTGDQVSQIASNFFRSAQIVNKLQGLPVQGAASIILVFNAIDPAGVTAIS
jgi:hypothetical protein